MDSLYRRAVSQKFWWRNNRDRPGCWRKGQVVTLAPKGESAIDSYNVGTDFIFFVGYHCQTSSTIPFASVSSSSRARQHGSATAPGLLPTIGLSPLGIQCSPSTSPRPPSPPSVTAADISIVRHINPSSSDCKYTIITGQNMGRHLARSTEEEDVTYEETTPSDGWQGFERCDGAESLFRLWKDKTSTYHLPLLREVYVRLESRNKL